MTGLAVLLTFACVFVLALASLSVLSRLLDQYEERYAARGAQELGEMFYVVQPRQLVVLALCASVVLAVLGWMLAGWVTALIGALSGLLAPVGFIRWIRRRRIRAFERQLVDALTQMSSALRAGLSLAQAAEIVSNEMAAPLGQEFGLFIKELKLGVPMEEALDNLAGRVESEDLQLVVTSTNIARQIGGNMAEMFEIVSATIRERFRIEGRIRAMTAQGKLQGWVVGSLPLLLGAFLYFWRPELMRPMLDSSFGVALVITVAVMEAVGMWLIRRIVAIEV